MSGEGLQHEDGHSHLLASVVPTVRAYDPAFAYEMATIVEHGIHHMFGPEAEDCTYYLTLYNENYPMPAMPVPTGDEATQSAAAATIRDGILRGIYRFAGPAAAGGAAVAGGRAGAAGDSPAAAGDVGAAGDSGGGRSATIFFSGTAWQAAMEARELLASDWGVAAEAWSVTSYKALREDALEVERWNRLHPGSAPRVPYLTRALQGAKGPIVAVTDFLKAIPDQIARFVSAPFTPLGTDGFGRSDTRAALRGHFEVDAAHIVIAVLSGLAAAGDAKSSEVAAAIEKYGVDPEAPDPRVA
jgi:pyruvate dehydrogenase E1 component